VSRTTSLAGLLWEKCGIVIPSLLLDFVTLTWHGTDAVDSNRLPREPTVHELVMGTARRVEDTGG
jgi:hypothetical protein